ncbi:DUF1217 domain-containing protein [Roseobacter sp. GAI101]|uniref:DUF1217 domain-containing protein n=1 Tax=Roseobacter sp. (strain GAI101) TaxID=391589 RepID=UPI00018725D3|nr:DUF1217 domain-containing protein [Roseobacter sp. GAI101]EEB86375.1 flagellar protein, putative [Roseobacter sp. GAI101]
MFQPIIPLPGLSGWRFLQTTYDRQFETFTKSVELKRDTEYFQKNIGAIETAEGLVKDRRLLTVTLGAFGLQDDINNRYFIRKVLEEGTTNDDSLANRFADPRYAELSKAFGFGPNESRKNGASGFAAEISAKFQANSFEVSTGDQDQAMRIALYAQRQLVDIAESDGSVDTKWFTIMGDPPLRNLFQKALNLPESFGQIDIDQQLGVFKERAKKAFGTEDIATFGDTEKLQELITKFIVKDQIDNLGSSLSSGSIALTLLQR